MQASRGILELDLDTVELTISGFPLQTQSGIPIGLEKKSEPWWLFVPRIDQSEASSGWPKRQVRWQLDAGGPVLLGVISWGWCVGRRCGGAAPAPGASTCPACARRGWGRPSRRAATPTETGPPPPPPPLINARWSNPLPKTEKKGAWSHLFIVLLLVGRGRFLVEQRIEADQEEHVDHQQRDDPDDDDDHHLRFYGQLDMITFIWLL